MVCTSLLMGGTSKVQGVYLSALWAAVLRKEFNHPNASSLNAGPRVYTRINIGKDSELDNIPTESFSWRRETSVLLLALFTRSRAGVQVTAAQELPFRCAMEPQHPPPSYLGMFLLWKPFNANEDYMDLQICRETTKSNALTLLVPE